MCLSRLSPFARLRALLDRRLYHALLAMRIISPRVKATDIPRSNTQRAVGKQPALGAPYGTDKVSLYIKHSVMATVGGTYGRMRIDYHGRILQRLTLEPGDDVNDVYPEIAQFDTTEYAIWAHSVGVRLEDGVDIDVLDIGYWSERDGHNTYVPADDIHRQFTAGLLCMLCGSSIAKGSDHVCTH